jgi:hypothetical protein
MPGNASTGASTRQAPFSGAGQLATATPRRSSAARQAAAPGGWRGDLAS